MRIAVGQLWQETNTFNRNLTTLSDFEHWGIATGQAVLEEYGDVGELGGFLQATRELQPQAEFVGLARFACWPWGRLSTETWQHVLNLFTEQLRQAEGIDAVFLALHGAMAAEDEPDVTGDLLFALRRVVGTLVPIVATLDLHANVTRQMCSSADALVGYHTCPHLDAFECGQRAGRALERIVRHSEQPQTILRKLPMITVAENHNTFSGPPTQLYETLRRWESDGEVFGSGLYMAMPWFDAPQLGWAIAVSTMSSFSYWRRQVNELAEECWNLREAMSDVLRFSPMDAIDRALEVEGHPVVIGDGADATNSGSPGDQTILLREFLARTTIPHGALTFLVDPEAIAVAERAGEGGSFHSFVGAAFAPEFGEPIELNGTVERIVDLTFVLDGHIGSNLPIRMGTGAVIRSNDVTVLICERSGPGSTPSLYEAAGLDPRKFGIVVAKSPAGFRADYESIASEIILLDGSGCASPHFDWLEYREVSRPLWPLNQIARPEEANWC